jgi:WD40 repeat protein
MSRLALVPNGVWAVRPRRTNSELATKLSMSRLIQRRRIRFTCLKLPAIAALALVLLFLGAAMPQAALAAPGTWSQPIGDMGMGRVSHTATMLPGNTAASSMVLVVGGIHAESTGSDALLFDTAVSDTWRYTGFMSEARANHTATLLPSGKVLVAGGSNNNYATLYSAEIYDPATGKWSSTGSLKTARCGHSATLLPSGQVLVAGLGFNDPYSAELYDPATGTWSYTGSMNAKRIGHTATLLSNGKVLVVGGADSPYLPFAVHASAELYDPAAGTWSYTGSMNVKRIRHTATLLPNGKVLVAGGDDGSGTASGFHASAELYDPAMGTWSYTGSMNEIRVSHTATLLPNGKVLVAGGKYLFPISSAELYDPVAGTWSYTGSMNIKRESHTATLLADKRVLVATGIGGSAYPYDYLATADLYEPEPPPKVKLPALLAFFPFEGDARDASGNGRHGTVPGFGPYLVPGYQGQAYFFNGTTDYIIVPLDINPGKYPRLTMGGWAKKAASSNSIQPLLNHDNGAYDRQVGLDTRGGGIGWSAFCGPTGWVLGAVPAILDKWTFVAVVYDQTAQTVKLQVDDMVLTKTGVSLGPGQTAMYIAASPMFQTYFRGSIDNVFVFRDALTDQQLAYIRSGGAPAILTATRKANPNILLLLLND